MVPLDLVIIIFDSNRPNLICIKLLIINMNKTLHSAVLTFYNEININKDIITTI